MRSNNQSINQSHHVNVVSHEGDEIAFREERGRSSSCNELWLDVIDEHQRINYTVVYLVGLSVDFFYFP